MDTAVIHKNAQNTSKKFTFSATAIPWYSLQIIFDTIEQCTQAFHLKLKVKSLSIKFLFTTAASGSGYH